MSDNEGTSSTSFPDVDPTMEFAIIGLACRMPGHSNTPSEFYSNLVNGEDLVSTIPNSRYNATYYHDLPSSHPSHLASDQGGLMDDPFSFDHSAFQMSKHEAEHRDPKSRILLELALETFEDASSVENYVGSDTGVFVGAGVTGVTCRQLNCHWQTSTTVTATTICMEANLVSFKFDLRGPSMVVATGCSSSAYALTHAVDALRASRCGMALVAGAALLFDPRVSMGYTRLGVLSPDGRCKSFDSSANGYVRSEGVGMFLIKPLRAAIADGNKIYCVLGGVGCTADGQSGGTKSLTTPSGEAQAIGLRRALAEGGVTDPREVFFLECHATGTPVGDPVEANAAGEVLCFNSTMNRKRSDDNFPKLKIGSVKANVGHLEHASFVASFVKCVMMMYKGIMVPNILLRETNPDIHFKEFEMEVQTVAEEFDPHQKILLINSFGFGGANVCALIRGYRPALPPSPQMELGLTLPHQDPPYGFVVMGRTSEAVSRRIESMKKYVVELTSGSEVEEEEEGETSIETLSNLTRLMSEMNKRKIQQHRFCSVGLCASLPNITFSPATRIQEKKPLVCMVFSGQGPQHPLMGRKLYRRFGAFRKTIDACHVAYAKANGGESPILRVFGPDADATVEEMRLPAIVLPTLTSLQMALFDLWKSVGVTADAVLFHSLGEMSCLYACGAASLEVAMELVHARVKVVSAITELGGMMAVGASKREVVSLMIENGLDDQCWIAANNSPVSCTVGGIADAIQILAGLLAEMGVFHRVLNIAKAFHTPLVKSAKQAALDALPHLDEKLNPVEIPVLNTVRKARLIEDQLSGMHVWENVRHEVRFASAVNLCFKNLERLSHGRLKVEVDDEEEEGAEVEDVDAAEQVLFLEIAPHPVLSRSLKECGATNILHCMNRRKEEMAAWWECCCALKQFRVDVDWDGLIGPQAPLDDVPRYPFEKKFLLFDTPDLASERAVAERETMPALIGRRVADLNPGRPSNSLWVNYFSSETHPLLCDHVVQNTPIMPAAAFLEMCLEVASPKMILEDVSIKSSLTIPDAPIKLFTRCLDNVVEVLSSPHDNVQADWTLHVVGRSAELSGTVDDFPREFSLPVLERAIELDSQQVYNHLKELQLQYGELFRPIKSALIGDNECLVTVTVPPLPKLSHSYIIYPPTLDAFFQAFELAYYNVSRTYLPSSVGRFVLLDPAAFEPKEIETELLCHVLLTFQDEEKYVGDIMVYSEGKCVLFMKDFTFVRLGGDRVSVRAGEADCHLVWQTKTLPLVNIDLSKGPEKESEGEGEGPNRDALTRGVVAHYLKDQLEELRAWTDVDRPERARFVAWADAFASANEVTSAPEVLDQLEDFGIEKQLMERVGENLLDLHAAQGDDLHQIMEGDDLLDRFYSESSSCSSALDQFVSVMSSLLEDLVTRQNRVVRILEVGAGDGGLARRLFPALAPYTGLVEYFFTDESSSVLIEKEDLSEYSFVRYKTLDLTEAFSEDLPRFDIVIAYHTLWQFSDVTLRDILPRVQSSLVPGGLFFLLEMTSETLPEYLNFCFGMYDEWWFADPKKTRAQWGALLEELSFDGVETVAAPGQAISLISARKSRTESLLLSLETEVSEYEDLEVFDSPDSWALVETVQRKLGEGWNMKGDECVFVVFVHDMMTDPAYSSVYGVAKVIQNELPWNTFIVDLGTSTEIPKLPLAQRIAANPGAFENQFGVVLDSSSRIMIVPRLLRLDMDVALASTAAPEDRSGFRAELLGQRNVGFRAFPIRDLGARDVLVGVHSTSLNFRDVLGVVGLISGVGFNSLGDTAGEVLAVGSDVSTLKPGDVVFGGTLIPMSNRIVTHESLLTLKPQSLNLEEAGTIPTVWVTAYVALVQLAHVQPGDRVLVHSASGGVGQAAIQIASWKGAEVFATVGSEAKRQYLRDRYGIEHFGDSHTSTWDQEILKGAPGGVDVILNSLAGDHIARGLRLLRSYGRFVEIGKSDIMKDSPVGLNPFLKNLSLLSLQLDLYFNDQRGRDRYQEALSSLAEGFASGVLQPTLDSTFPLTRIRDACDYMLQNKHMGKIAVIIDQPDSESVLPPQVTFSPAKTYILSGGLGAVGFELCRYLVAHGARSVVLMSRSGRLKRFQKQEIARMESEGARVYVSKTDVTDADAVQVMFDSFESVGLPTEVGGIAHLAMILRDGPMHKMTRDDFDTCRAVKIVGANNLIAPFAGTSRRLDFFVCFSSVSSLLGNPMQANYSAGNTELESLCRRLRSEHGIVASSIQLGAIGDVGVLTQDVELRRHLVEDVFGEAVLVSEVIASFVRATRSISEAVLAPPMDCNMLVDNFPRSMRSIVSHLTTPVVVRKTSDSGEGAEVTPESVAAVVRVLLQMDEEDVIDPDEPLTAYGMDSLTAVDFAWRVRKQFDLEISQMQVLGGISVNAIVAKKRK